MESDQLTSLELENVRLTALDLTSELDSKQLLEKVIERSRELLGADAGGIYFLNEAERTLRVEFFSGEGQSMLGNTLGVDEGLVGQVVRKGKPIVVDNYGEWESRSKALDRYPFRAVIGVPLIAQQRKLGALYLLNYDEEKRFSNRDAHVLEVFASYAAVALANAAVFEEHRRTLLQLKLINSLNERLNHAVDIDEILQITLEESLSAVKSIDGSVMMLDDRTGELEIKAWIVKGKKANSKDHKRFHSGEGVAGYVAQTGEPYNCGDTSQSKFFVPSFTNRKIGSLLSVPIILHHRVFCIINADRNEPNYFTDVEMEMLRNLAGHVAIAIESQLLRSVGISLSALPLEELYPAIAKSAVQLTGSDVGTIFLKNQETGDVDRVALFPLSIETSEAEAKGDGLTRRIIQRGRLLQLTGWKLSKLARPEVLRRGTKSLLGAPLMVRLEDDVQTIGVLFVSTKRQKHYEKRDQAILQSLANQAAVVIERTKNVKKLQENMLFRESLLQHAFDAIVAVDEHGMVRICNQSAQKILGISEPEAIGKQVTDFFRSKESADRVLEMLKEKGQVVSHYTEVQNQAGEVIPIRLSCIQLEEGSVGFFQDRRELESAKRHSKQLKQLMEAGQAITKLTDEKAVLRAVVSKTIETLKADVVCFHIWADEQQKVLQPICAGSLPEGVNHSSLFPPKTVEAIRGRKDIYFADNVRRDRLLKSSHRVIASAVAAPLTLRDKTVGVIFCSYLDQHPFDDEEKAMMRLYFNGVATAIENARLYDEVNLRAEVIQGLYKAGMTHLLGSEPKLRLKAWLDQVRSVTNAGYALLEVVSFENEGEPLAINSGDNLAQANSWIEAPIMLGKQTIGRLYVSHKQRAPKFNAQDEDILKMLAGSAAMMTELTRLRTQARSMQSSTITFLALYHWVHLISKTLSRIKKLIENHQEETAGDLFEELTALNKAISSPLGPMYQSIKQNMHKPVDVGALLKKCAKQVSERLERAATTVGMPQASSVAVTKNIQPNCMVAGEPLLLELAFELLLDNAVSAIEKKHDRPVQLRLEVSQDGDSVLASISDTGTGIGSEIEKDLFQVPLNNADGLGYGALAAGMVFKLHQGSIQIAATGKTGTSLQIRLAADKN